jgi:uncharacterized damage-inducible protein DinB
MDKREIIAALEDSREEFLEALEELPREMLLEPGVNGEWTLKDLLAHLTMWEAEQIKLLWQTSQGMRPTTIHISGISDDQANEQWYQLNRERPLERVLEDFYGIRAQTIRRVQSFKDEDLTNPRRYPWLKNRPLWKWIAEDTFEHEAEHLSQVRDWLNQRGNLNTPSEG